MKPPNKQPAPERECGEVLQQWEDWSETPILARGRTVGWAVPTDHLEL